MMNLYLTNANYFAFAPIVVKGPTTTQNLSTLQQNVLNKWVSSPKSIPQKVITKLPPSIGQQLSSGKQVAGLSTYLMDYILSVKPQQVYNGNLNKWVTVLPDYLK
jgi:hypothetical protein